MLRPVPPLHPFSTSFIPYYQNTYSIVLKFFVFQYLSLESQPLGNNVLLLFMFLSLCSVGEWRILLLPCHHCRPQRPLSWSFSFALTGFLCPCLTEFQAVQDTKLAFLQGPPISAPRGSLPSVPRGGVYECLYFLPLSRSLRKTFVKLIPSCLQWLSSVSSLSHFLSPSLCLTESLPK